MDSDRAYRRGRVPLPGPGDSWQAGPAELPGPPRPASGHGIRHIRRMSNWTAAALIVGTGAATVALAHQAMPAAAPASSAGAATGAGAAATGAGATAGATGPRAVRSVATTSGSGVTTTTTTRTVGGKTIVTHVRHAPAYHDN
jgi:hypothetical protein